MTRLGLVGATGLVGTKICEILAERAFPLSGFRAFASNRSVGRMVECGTMKTAVEEAESADYAGLDVVIMSAGGATSTALAPRIAATGSVVIDNSSAWRRDPDVPLVVSGVNHEDLHVIPKGIVANPNCTTMVAMPVLKPLDSQFGLRRMIATTFQAVSGSGVRGVAELESQLAYFRESQRGLVHGFVESPPLSGVYPKAIAHNVVPLAGALVDDETEEEIKLRYESRRILHREDIDVTATCVRVPVFSGHALSLDLEFAQNVEPAEVEAVLAQAREVLLDPIPVPLDAVGGDVTRVGRIRRSGNNPHRIALFVAGDNLRKGAALNTVQIAERLVKV